jgi:hypothetical protein
MDIVADIRSSLSDEWLPTIYEERIRSQRTRSVRIDIDERENAAEIQYTLLGIELKVGNRRFACPDLATARYMRVFARIGCIAFAIPYDITQISAAADSLETSWQRMLLVLSGQTSGRPGRSVSQVRSKLIRSVREAIAEMGAGEIMPDFDRKTKQRTT